MDAQIMSTIQERRKSPASRDEELDPFRYGWRDVLVPRPDGGLDHRQLPLTLADVLHPQEGDHHALTRAHILDCMYLLAVVSARVAHERHILVLSDTGVYWDHPELEHHSPDISVIPGVRRREGDWRSFHVAKEGTRPSLIIEVVSPNTRQNDVVRRVTEYALAQVARYVIVDVSAPAQKRQIAFIDYRLGSDAGYQRQPLDASGRVWLDRPIGLWLGKAFNPEIGGERLALFDPDTGDEIGDYQRVSEALARSERARAEAETKAKKAETKAQKAETMAKKAATKAKKADARAREAEVRARAEAELRMALEERIRRLESGQGPGGQG
jgi:colicin import membrane protein